MPVAYIHSSFFRKIITPALKDSFIVSLLAPNCSQAHGDIFSTPRNDQHEKDIMKKILALVLLFSISFITCGKKEEGKTDMLKEHPQSGETSTTLNSHCMVESDQEVDTDVTFVLEGKTYAFCCKECIPKFQKEPAKYIAAYEALRKEGKVH